MKKYIQILFVIIFFMIAAYPLYGMIWYEEHEITENKVLASWPSLIDEQGHWNTEYISGMGNYFSDHFAGRQEFITANALLYGGLLKSSSENIVITGKDGWLFYKDSLADYQGTRRITQRGLNNIVTSLSLIQEYVQGQGKTFLFTIAPNKNSLYPQYMPYYYPIRQSENTLELLEPLLNKHNIAYVDLKDMFLENGKILYHKGDSHWTNEGAAYVQALILDALGKASYGLEKFDPVIVDNFEGDLDKILYPLARHQEVEWDYSQYFTFNYVDGNTDTTRSHIETYNPFSEDSLVMVRDSFGNSLLPLMAQAFETAYFTKIIPYRVDEVEKRNADVYIIEIVERNLDQFQRKAAVLPAPERQAETNTTMINSMEASATVSEYDIYYKISGRLDEAWTDATSPVYLKLSGSDGRSHLYEMFPAYEEDLLEVTSDYGFTGYIPKEILENDRYTLSVMTLKSGQWVSSSIIGEIN